MPTSLRMTDQRTRSSSTQRTRQSEFYGKNKGDSLLIFRRVLPSVKKAVDSGAKLNSIINTHQSVAALHIVSKPHTEKVPAIMITQEATFRW